MPFDRNRYPNDWDVVSEYIRFFRANGKCEGSPPYPHCQAEHGLPHPVTGSTVVLTTAHIGAPWPDGTPGDKHDKMDCRPDNLKAMCQRCHLTFDVDEHVKNAAETRRKRAQAAGQLTLIEAQEE